MYNREDGNRHLQARFGKKKTKQTKPCSGKSEHKNSKSLIEATNPNAFFKTSRRRMVPTEQWKANRGCSIASKATLAEHSCLTLFSDNRVGHFFVTLLSHALVGHSCGTLLWDLHTSQNITFSHFPHRQRGDVIRDPRHENDPQTVHHPRTPRKENKNPSLRTREKNLL